MKRQKKRLMRLFSAIAVCKILYFVGRLVGKGSSLPGRVALAVCPDALKRVKLPERVIAVTGSNGKTSTTEMIAHALGAAGMKAAWNREGANQVEGVATLILRAAAPGGAARCDALVLECDERSAREIFSYVPPSVLVVTNLCRDQLTRNGHPEFVQGCIRAAVETAAAGAGLMLVLNADDPYVTALATALEQGAGPQTNSFSFFGISRSAVSFGLDGQTDGPSLRSGGMYDDGAFCPVCKERMTYEYRVMGHMGGYRCGACGHERPGAQFEAERLGPDTGEVTLSGGIRTRLAFPSAANVYNLAAAVAAVSAAGFSAETAARALDGFGMTGGRAQRFSVGGREGTLLVSKHENSLSYDQSLTWAASRSEPCTVVIMVDSISRKYYTGETSWLWDVDFDILAAGCVRNIVLTGRYVNELAARIAMTRVSWEKVCCVGDPAELRNHIEKHTVGEIVAVTCFSDKEKLLKALRGG